MKEYEDEFIAVNGIERTTDQKYIGSICAKCGKMSNHDEIDEDICIHCGEKFGDWEHIYDPPNEKYFQNS
jgi:DNA-directed RNA polymerase subunit RPC12/RpoP